MAKFLSTTPDGSIFMGNPIVYSVQSAALASDSVAFHRVRLEVSIGSYRGEMSQPVSGHARQTVQFDVSSCFRAAASLQHYAPITAAGATYPTYTATIVAKDVWIEDGQARESGGDEVQSVTFTAVAGQFSDYERRAALTAYTFTRKPAKGELVMPGDAVVSASAPSGFPAGSLALSATLTRVPESAAPLSAFSIPTSAMTVVSPKAQPSVQFQFVNSRGVIESVRAFTHFSDAAAANRAEYVLSVFERLRDFSRNYVRTTPKPSQLGMTSGFVPRAWAAWWAYEFCMSSQVWMLVPAGADAFTPSHTAMATDVWLPVRITTSDKTTVIDTSKSDLPHVDFTVQPDLRGGLF